jgi:hypothetical protein
LNEFIFKASDNGQLYIDAATNNKVILRPGDNTTAQAAVQKRMKITQLLFQLNETRNRNPWKQCIYTFAAFNGSN